MCGNHKSFWHNVSCVKGSMTKYQNDSNLPRVLFFNAEMGGVMSVKASLLSIVNEGDL